MTPEEEIYEKAYRDYAEPLILKIMTEPVVEDLIPELTPMEIGIMLILIRQVASEGLFPIGDDFSDEV